MARPACPIVRIRGISVSFQGMDGSARERPAEMRGVAPAGAGGPSNRPVHCRPDVTSVRRRSRDRRSASPGDRLIARDLRYAGPGRLSPGHTDTPRPDS